MKLPVPIAMSLFGAAYLISCQFHEDMTLQEVGAEDPEPVFAILIFLMPINFIPFYCLEFLEIFGSKV
jgi:hypothetical protein